MAEVKTVRLDDDVINIIEAYPGKSFSDKLRNLIYDFSNSEERKLIQKKTDIQLYVKHQNGSVRKLLFDLDHIRIDVNTVMNQLSKINELLDTVNDM